MVTSKKSQIISHFAVLCCLFLFSTCKKEVVEKDFETSSDILTVLNLEGVALKMIDRLGGGYILVYTEIVDFSFNDIAVAVVDEQGTLLSKNKFGGKLDDYASDAVSDDNGNVYIAGYTNSPELRMDLYTKETKSADAYLAKIDKNGQLLWQRGFSDTTSGNEGSQHDDFVNIFLINNKVYCVGTTSNWQTPNGFFTDWETWIVLFDENGNKIKHQLLPSNPPGGSFSGVRETGAIKLIDDDLLIRWTASELLATGRDFDTTSIWMRFNTKSDSLQWVQYFQNGTPEGDISLFSQLGDASIFGYTSNYKTIVKINPDNGIVTNTQQSTFSIDGDLSDISYWARVKLVEDNLYMVGYYSNGFSVSYADQAGWGQYSQIQPWLVKIRSNGDIIYDKRLDVPQGYFTDMAINANGNLQFFGGMYKFGTKNETLFLVSTDKDGNIIPIP